VFDERVVLPCDDTIRSLIVKTAIEVEAFMIVKLLEDTCLRQRSPVISGTLDTGSDVSGNVFVTVNLHYLDNSTAKPVKMCLGVIDLEGGYKCEEDINKVVKPLLRRFGLTVSDAAEPGDDLNGKSDLSFLVTDTGKL